MKLGRCALLVLVVAVVAVFPIAAGGQPEGGAAAPAKQYVLKFGHVLTPQDPYHLAFQKWAKAVAEKTNGNLKIELFPSSQLGVEEDVLEQIKAGANIGWNTDAARLAMYVSGMAVMNAPYFVESLDEVQKLSELPTVKGWEDQLAKQYGIKILSFEWVQGFRNVVCNKPITSPQDLAGQRIRAPSAPIWQESIRAIGATPVALNYGDMYPALQTRAIDGCELSPTATNTMKIYEVNKYLSETRHILLINFEVVSSKWFDSLPADYQKILVDECNTAGLDVSRFYMETSDVQAKETLKQKGMTIVPVSEIDMAAFRAAGEAAYRKLDILSVRDRIYEELGKSE